MMHLSHHIRRVGPLLALATLAACAREDEAAMRARLEGWVSLGPTQYFSARADCAVGVFGLVSDAIGAAMPVAGSVEEMAHVLRRQGRAALDDPAQSPDGALIALANADRVAGYAMRRAALDGRACMDATAAAAFHAALTAPGAVLAWDGDSGTVMVIDRDARRFIAAVGGA